MSQNILETILLLALPASGKSEVRRYLSRLAPDVCEKDFHLGPTVQLDDYPYVHLMRRIDEELVKAGGGRIFFKAPDKPFNDAHDWGTLIALINEDYDGLVIPAQVRHTRVGGHLDSRSSPGQALDSRFRGNDVPRRGQSQYFLARIDEASAISGAGQRLTALGPALLKKLTAALDHECRELAAKQEKNRPPLEKRQSPRDGQRPASLFGKTVVIEFARGGPDGAAMPLPEPLGYRYSIGQLSEAILKKACVLYVWVTPEESRRKNTQRADPNKPGSILHHGVPLEVMLNDYGTDDIAWLEANAERPGTLTIEAHGKKFHLPCARFDNRVDKTSFLREKADTWDKESMRLVHERLKEAFGKLFANSF
ncbi:MAG: hypothetical protein HY747_01295 [Elusimicrobia bacterium]|nr:hypothetical protein [Elusimicrobiota bacterium]